MVLPPGGQVAGGADDRPLPPLGPRAVPGPAHCKGRCCSLLMELTFSVSLVGAAPRIIFVVTKVLLQQTCKHICRDKTSLLL